MQKQLDEASKQSQERSRIYRENQQRCKKEIDGSSKFFEVNDGMDDIVANEQHRIAGFPQQNGEIARSSYAEHRLW